MIGVVYDPTRDEMFTAQAGMARELDGMPIRHPGKEKLLDCVVSLSLPRRGWATRDRNDPPRHSRVAQHGQRRARPRIPGQRPLRRVRPGRRPVAVGHLRRRA